MAQSHDSKKARYMKVHSETIYIIMHISTKS